MSDQAKEYLAAEIQSLRAEVALLNRHRFVTIHNSIPRLVAFRFISGLAFGLGTVLGGSILLSFVVLALSSIDFIPVIGEWAVRIAEEMQLAR
jgi:hypothetical protein